ncbi:MAG TPA: PAS domain S-box protein [bacterium]
MTSGPFLTLRARTAALLAVAVAVCAPGAGATRAAEPAPREIQVGAERDFRPYSFVDEQGRPAGLGIDLIRAVAQTMGLRIRIVPSTWDAAWNGLVAGELDALPVVARLPSRMSQVDFGLPHTETFDAFFVRRGDPAPATIEQAQGKVIAVLRSDAAHHALVERRFRGALVPVDSTAEMFSLLVAGRCDALLYPRLLGELEIRERRLRGLVAGPPIPDYKRVFSFAVKKGDADLLEKLNEGLLIVKASGGYNRIYEKWLAVDDPWVRLRPYLAPAAGAMLLLSVLGALWTLSLRREVRRRTAEAAERRRAEEAARESETRYRLLFERNPTPMWVFDEETYRFLAVNEAAVRHYGWSREEFLAMTILDVRPPEERERVRAVIETQRGSREAGVGVHRHWRRDGAEIAVDITVSSVPFAGRPGRLCAMVDVTERTRAEEALRESERTLDAIFRAIPYLVSLHAPDGRWLKANPAVVEFFGFDPVGAPREDIARRLHARLPDGTPLTAANMPSSRALRGETVLGAEYLMDDRRGRVRRLLINAVPFLGEGEVRGAVFAQEDITEFRAAEEAIRTAADFLRLINESAGLPELIRGATAFLQRLSGCEAVGIRLRRGPDFPYYETVGFPRSFVQLEDSLCSREPDGRLRRDTACNPVLECMCGNVILGRFDPAQPFFTAAGSFWTNSTTQVLASTNEADRQARTRNRCNGEGYESVALIPLVMGRERLGLIQFNDRRPGCFSAEGIAFWERLAGYLGVAVAKFSAEEELRRSREDLARAQEVGQIGSWRLDVRHDVLTWSRENHRIFGLPEGTPLTYETFLGLVHPEDRAHVDRAWQAGMRGSLYDVEHRIIVDGRVKWVRERAFLELDAAGELMGGFGITQDVTKRKLAEQRLRELNETLEQRVAWRTAEANRLADQLRALAARLAQSEQRERKRLARILHDHIQQFLVVARMQLESLRRESSPERRQACLQSADAILLEALAASRSLAVDLCPPVVYEAGLVAGLNWLAKRMGEQHRIAVEVHAEKGAEPAGEETRVLLFECARELLLNAAKHAGVAEAQLLLRRAGADDVELTVQDRGRGFEASTLAGRDADSVTFGLFSIRERLAYVGGRMTIESSPGQGTRVTLTAPIAADAKPGGGDVPMEQASGERRQQLRVGRKDRDCRVLIVDDHRIMREGLRGLLAFERGIEVVGEAAGGPEAIELVARLAPDVVIIDVNLDGMSGMEATRRILAQNASLKVIGLSMHIDPEVAQAMRDAGAAAYLTKGGPCEDLIAAIRAAAPAPPGEGG